MILQKEEKRIGRRRRKKKTLMEQLEEMGGFGDDPDSEQAIIEELECRDTRAPLQHSQDSISECEVSFGESSFWETRKRLFHSWSFQANRPSSWIQEKDLPLLFRFALRRPIMDERNFQFILQAMDLQLETSTGDARQPHTRPIGRSRKLMFGIDVDEEKDVHPSNKFRHALPLGAGEDMDGAMEETTSIIPQDDEDLQQLVQRQLWSVYEHVQNGSVPLETATWHYRDVFDDQDMSDETLVIWLRRFGIPTNQISASEGNAQQSSAHCPFPSSEKSFDDETEEKTITGLGNYIGLYRSGALQEDEVIPMIQLHLGGLKLDANTISDILTDLDKDEKTAALLMWVDACADDDACPNDDTSVSSGSLYMSSSSSSSSSSEEKIEDSGEEQEAPLRAVMVPHSHANVEKDLDAAVALSVDGGKSLDYPTAEDMDYGDSFKDNESKQSKACSMYQQLTTLPAIAQDKLPIYGLIDEAESRVLPPGTPRPKSASLPSASEISDNHADVEFDRELPSDRANVGRRRLSSSDEGMTTGIWGLLMPTKEARKLAYKLKLPQHIIDAQVRSISPRRERRRRASHAKTVVTFPRSKRKASIALHKGTPPKSPKHRDHSDLFAREGEDQEAFVLSHFDRDANRSEHTCMRCLCLPCECEFGTSPCSEFGPECPICLQHPCMCVRPPQVGKASQTALHKGNPSFDALNANLADRTRPERPKQSITLLDYLARVLNDNNVLASIKQLERLSPAHTAVADAKIILHHIRQSVHVGLKLDITGDDDQKLIRLLDVVIQSSQTLTDYTDQLAREEIEEDHATASVNDCHDEEKESPDLDSPDSSPDHECVPASPLSPVASAAAFPGNQSNAANGAFSQANNTGLAKSALPHPTTAAPDSRVPHLELSSGIEDAVQQSCFQTATAPDSSAAGDPSTAEAHSASPGRGKLSTAGGNSSKAECPSESPAEDPLSSATNLSEQVSGHPVDAEVDTDDTSGPAFAGQPHTKLRDMGNSDIETQQPPSSTPGTRALRKSISSPSPREGAKQSPDRIPPLSPRQSFKKSPKSIPPATPRLGTKELSKNLQTTSLIGDSSPGFDSLPLWPPQPGCPGQAGNEWKGMTPKEALEYAKSEAFKQRKSLAFYLEERRAVRTRIEKEKNFANSKWSDHRFFQSSNGLSGSSGTVTTQALNKLFDKYRGTSKV